MIGRQQIEAVSSLLADAAGGNLGDDVYAKIVIGGLDQATFDSFGEPPSPPVEQPCANPGCDCLTVWKEWVVLDGGGDVVVLRVGMALRSRRPA